MVKRNPQIAKLHGNYLFPEIHKRKHELLKKVPNAQIISLGIGDTTEPIPEHILSGLVEGAAKLGTREGYSGYGPEQGHELLRTKIAHVAYQDKISPDEVFISDGCKCDIGRLQVMFGSHCRVAIQDPSYPVYVDTAVTVGQTGPYKDSQYEGIVYMPCTPENGFFPDLDKLPPADIIYFCSPNNPTGAAATREQLQALVNHAKKTQAILVFDAAYSCFLRDPSIPSTIYEIPHAKEVAIEMNSFSKKVGFTGVRLAWSVVPKELLYSDGFPVRADWQRMMNTFFNGASNIAQQGALNALDPLGLQEMRAQSDFYLGNAALIRKIFVDAGYPVYGGVNGPYLWVHFKGRKSWDVFTEILEKAHVLCTPGIGFGPSGEGFIRFSSFGHREKVEEAVKRLRQLFCC